MCWEIKQRVKESPRNQVSRFYTRSNRNCDAFFAFFGFIYVLKQRIKLVMIAKDAFSLGQTGQAPPKEKMTPPLIFSPKHRPQKRRRSLKKKNRAKTIRKMILKLLGIYSSSRKPHTAL
jgi:hypothetical protein